MPDQPTQPNTAPQRQSTANIAAATRHNRINLLWEYTQALLAVALVAAMIYASLRVTSVRGPDGLFYAPVPETLKSATFVVLGFYFGRTNHTRPTAGDKSES